MSKGLNSEIDYIIHISFFDPNISFSLLITFNGHKNKDSVKKKMNLVVRKEKLMFTCI